MKKNNKNNVLALAFILMGIFFLLKMTNLPFVSDINLGYIIGILWPLFILVPGLNMLRNKVDLGGIILTVLGGSFLLDNLLSIYNIDFKATSVFKFFWPALFIYIGFKMLSRNERDHHVIFSSASEINGGSKSDSINFGSKEYKFTKESMAEGITHLNLNISFGGAEIIVDEGIQVILVGQYTFGGHEFFNKDAGGIHSSIKEVRYEGPMEDAYDQTLVIDARINFGGLEISTR